MKSKLVTLLFLICLVAPVNAKVVALDIVQIYQKYSLVQEANNKIEEAEARVKRVLETADNELKELETKGKKEEVEAKKDSIQDIVDEELEKLQDDKEFYNMQINRNISKLLQETAKEKGIDLVLEKGYVQSDIEDITASFLVKLEAARLQEAKATEKAPQAAKPKS